jgi:ketosteroid isomerase-like protein
VIIMRKNRLDSRTTVSQIPFVLATLALLGLVVLPATPCRSGEISDEIDSTVWEVISTTVVANDIEGMAATYHSDAVLVSPKGTVSIAEQLVKWGEGMERIELEGRSASVSFRFASRQDDAETAFESGMFRYAETDEQGDEQPRFVPFEALLVKKDGRWLMVMERQLEGTDEGAWNALGSLSRPR